MGAGRLPSPGLPGAIFGRNAAVHHAVADQIAAQPRKRTLDNVRLIPLRRLEIAERQQFFNDLCGDRGTPQLHHRSHGPDRSGDSELVPHSSRS